MARKYELINDLYDQIIVDVTKDARAWQSFLRTACRNYKLRFDEQLLLFAQRPDATAVLEIERWNTAFGRWVNRGAKGIAVFEDPSGKSQRLKYYFDITDTHGTKRSREVPVWKMSDEYQSDVTEALKNTFGTLSDLDSLESVIKESVSNAVDDNIDDYIYNFIRNGTGSEIDYISTDEAEEIYKRLVKNSVVYMISERLGADSGLTESDFEGIEYFSTHELLNSIGYATSDIAKMGLGVVAKTVRAIEKENQQAIMPDNNISYNSERSSNYERNHLHNAGRLSDSGSFITGTAGGNTRQMGTDEKGISEAAPQDNVLQSDDELSVNTVPRRNGTESTQNGGRVDQRDVGKTGTDRRAESKRYDEMGSADEQSQARSSRDSYSADNNERLSNIKPLPSINEQTAFIAEYEAEVTKASAFSVSPEENSDDKFRYQLLSRMQSDCNYMLGNGGAGAIRYLDGENVDTHIHNMLELYNSFSDNAKPEWISVEEIEGYREKLTALVAASGKEIQQNSVEKAESQKPEIPSDVDKFYVQPEIEQVTWIYYNPDRKVHEYPGNFVGINYKDVSDNSYSMQTVRLTENYERIQRGNVIISVFGYNSRCGSTYTAFDIAFYLHKYERAKVCIVTAVTAGLCKYFNVDETTVNENGFNIDDVIIYSCFDKISDTFDYIVCDDGITLNHNAYIHILLCSAADWDMPMLTDYINNVIIPNKMDVNLCFFPVTVNKFVAINKQLIKSGFNAYMLEPSDNWMATNANNNNVYSNILKAYIIN